MADPVYINVADGAEGAALVRSLGRHGLIAAVVRSAADWQVEVSAPREDPRSFLADVGLALAAWNDGDRGGTRAQRERRRAA